VAVDEEMDRDAEAGGSAAGDEDAGEALTGAGERAAGQDDALDEEDDEA
jgi:hypothetical protein